LLDDVADDDFDLHGWLLWINPLLSLTGSWRELD
jgi:hypothetical protein